VTTDDMGKACERLIDQLSTRGIGAGLVLVASPSTEVELPPSAQRAMLVSVSIEPPAASSTSRALWIGGGVTAIARLLQEQLDRRESGRVPGIDEDPDWSIELLGGDPALHRVHQTLLTVADSRFGTRGVREEEALGALPRVLAAGIFDEGVSPPALLEGPIWTGLHFLRPVEAWRDRRVLDLRAGLLLREQPAAPVPVRSVRFASLARPGCFGLRAEGPVDLMRAGSALVPPPGDGLFRRDQLGLRSTAETRGAAGGAIAAATSQRETDAHGYRTVERLACFATDPHGADCRDQAAAGLQEVSRLGFDALLAENRAAWAARWRDAEISIVGDADLARAVRFSLFQLMACVPTQGEAAVGPRGVAGPSYRGHVMWDADVFVLPFMAATCPSAARAMLEYRIRRLEPARRLAGQLGYRGARFPWESAGSGLDVTPAVDTAPNGAVVPIYTGEHEEHVVADVAWAAFQYATWTGDDAFLHGEGRPLVVDTARYWASRVRLDDAGGHIESVIGPDEYHELVDDNVFTNVMARWNLRRAAELADTGGDVPTHEIEQWRRIADAVVDGYDPRSGRYEQFAGYYALEPLVISELADTPVAADLLFGRERISSSQVIKQPDVLMLHHLVPEEMADGSLRPNLDFYEPRCAHGSSLSPAIHAGLLARAGRPNDALRLFRMACLLDLENLTGTTAGGLHVATFGGLWQALVFGFAGIRPGQRALSVDPRVPSAWEELRVTVRYRNRRVELRATPDTVHLRSDGQVPVRMPGAGTADVTAEGRRWRRADNGWEVWP
ncbi:MAG TPA: glycosyl hydrolase family 65 protein, partial [Kineosporiaceae bacterium]|nr:glycosyl hydrolase family 65 protein [Kineosporiaceae bacterium]